MKRMGLVLAVLCGVFCGGTVLFGAAVAQEADEGLADGEIQLTARIQEGRIILLWNPPNFAPSDGVKITRALTPEFKPGSVDQYTKWLPGTGYKQVVLFPSAASDKTFYYRVASIKTGEKARQLAVSNAVKVEPLREDTASSKKGNAQDIWAAQ